MCVVLLCSSFFAVPAVVETLVLKYVALTRES
jgi:hypothetical protein